MNFCELRDFLLKKMKLSHIYQPLLIKTLIDAGGSATVRQLATTFLSQDESQIIYYEKRLKEMPIRVLLNHEVITKKDNLIELNTGELSLKEKAEIKRICEEKIQNYIIERGLGIWDYRLLDTSSMPDLLRFRVLKEARGRCALCGATSTESMLDIDHIIPRSKGGKTEYSNLQVLCAKCNRSKGNKDNTDFRTFILENYVENCVFCSAENTREVISENDFCVSFLDGFPVTEGHTLIVPRRHVVDYFSMFEVETKAANDLLRIRQKDLLNQDQKIKGFNVGINIGECAGQTIEHCHIHLIPRREGGHPKPKGGVRGVIPDKQSY